MKSSEKKAGYFQRFQNLAISRMTPGVAIEKDSLTYWRVRILFAIVLTALIVGLFALVPRSCPGNQEKIVGPAVL